MKNGIYLQLHPFVGHNCLCTYLIYKHAPLGWFVVQREDVQVSSGGETRVHHRDQGGLRNVCDLRSNGQKSVTL